MANQFANQILNGIHASRYIASYANVGGDLQNRWQFIDWLQSVGLTEDEAWFVANLATCGKFELQKNAVDWLRNHPETEYSRKRRVL